MPYLKMNKKCFIGIDTSNYTTSVAICDMNGNIIANIKKLLFVENGERGLRQSDAVFAHIKNIPQLSDELREAICGYTPIAVGCSAYPRDAEGSYMPCFLTGVAVASSIAAVLGVPLMRFSHQNGHIMAALYSSGATEELINSRFAAFHVSGGTMEILDVTPSGNGFCVELIGGTDDLTAGQAIDRIGVAMGLDFPCGKQMEDLCFTEVHASIPKPRICVKSLHCNMSGLENLALKLYANTDNIGLVCDYTFSFVANTLDKLSENLRIEYPDIPIVYSGGVMSNSKIKDVLSKRNNTYFACPEFSSDNAAGVALLCRREFLNDK